MRGRMSAKEWSARVNIENLFILRFFHFYHHQFAAFPVYRKFRSLRSNVNHYLRLSTKQAAALYHIRSDTVYLRNLFSSHSATESFSFSSSKAFLNPVIRTLPL